MTTNFLPSSQKGAATDSSSSRAMSRNAVIYNLHTVWLFTASDHLTFVLPEFFMGLCGLLAKDLIPRSSSIDFATILRCSLEIFAWNWCNTLIFTLANQGSLDAVKEDVVNKPWRPIAAGRISVEQTRGLLASLIPIFGSLCHLYLGAFQETAVLICLTWIYNDLGASDKNFIIRNAVIAAAYFFYGKGSLQVATRALELALPDSTVEWLFAISCIIFFTMSVQDLKDQSGDKLKGRQTAPLVLGEKLSRWSIALPLVLASGVCCQWWKCSWLTTVACTTFGLMVAGRVIVLRGFEADRLTWKLWAFWLLGLYALPLASGLPC